MITIMMEERPNSRINRCFVRLLRDAPNIAENSDVYLTRRMMISTNAPFNQGVETLMIRSDSIVYLPQ